MVKTNLLAGIPAGQGGSLPLGGFVHDGEGPPDHVGEERAQGEAEEGAQGGVPLDPPGHPHLPCRDCPK
ncbi:MAG: hypothetical protein QXQ53_05080 [Candidatus Methanosuratincola sp.]